ncbi:MAG TPA: hypothetical protein VM737_12600, partial [Gemmatimonadota bacterium]|nr:hypothetical protein [Gemmatimonadota bacterium]
MHELHPSKLRLGVIGAPLLAAALLLAGCSVEPSGPPTAPEPRGALSVALRGPDLAAAIAAQERHTPGLLAIGGVVGTAVGLDQAGEPVVKV